MKNGPKCPTRCATSSHIILVFVSVSIFVVITAMVLLAPQTNCVPKKVTLNLDSSCWADSLLFVLFTNESIRPVFNDAMNRHLSRFSYSDSKTYREYLQQVHDMYAYGTLPKSCPRGPASRDLVNKLPGSRHAEEIRGAYNTYFALKIIVDAFTLSGVYSIGIDDQGRFMEEEKYTPKVVATYIRGDDKREPPHVLHKGGYRYDLEGACIALIDNGPNSIGHVVGVSRCYQDKFLLFDGQSGELFTEFKAGTLGILEKVKRFSMRYGNTHIYYGNAQSVLFYVRN